MLLRRYVSSRTTLETSLTPTKSKVENCVVWFKDVNIRYACFPGNEAQRPETCASVTIDLISGFFRCTTAQENTTIPVCSVGVTIWWVNPWRWTLISYLLSRERKAHEGRRYIFLQVTAEVYIRSHVISRGFHLMWKKLITKYDIIGKHLPGSSCGKATTARVQVICILFQTMCKYTIK